MFINCDNKNEYLSVVYTVEYMVRFDTWSLDEDLFGPVILVGLGFGGRGSVAVESWSRIVM